MENLYLEIVTPERIMVSQEVDVVVAPGTLGEFGVLKGHVPFLSGIVPGEIRYSSGGQTEYLAVSTGFAEVSDNKISVLVDTAEKSVDIDLTRAQRAMERARQRLEKDRDNEGIDFLRVEVALKRAIARIKVAEKAR
ncbi:MAG: F0F1 ATP synthase subunit epsilon [Thermodesulfobacteriota bacterium]|nr:F0F1 ATP synthase subunit epsilon [Thermodesulfobacteriota bacterium]